MSEDNIIKPDINISEKAQFFIDQAKSTFGKAKEFIIKAYEQLKEDGFAASEAKKILLRETGFGQATIYRALPDESKMQTKPKKDYHHDNLLQTKEEESDNNHKAMIEVTESRPVIEYEPEPVIKPPALQPTRTKQILNSKMFPTEQWRVFSKKEDCVFVATIENNQIKKIEVLGRKIAEKTWLTN